MEHRSLHRRPFAIFLALAREFWGLRRVRIVSAIVGLACMNCLYYDLVAPGGDALPPGAQLNLFFVTLFVDVALIVTLLFRSRDPDAVDGMTIGQRAFLLPLPTWQVVLAKIGFPSATAGLSWLAVSGLVLTITPRGATGDTWPLLGPALVAAVLTAWGLAIFALPLRSHAVRMVLALAVFSWCTTWTVGRFGGAGESPLQRMWVDPTWGELATLAALLLGAFATAVFGSGLARRGAGLSLPSLDGLVGRFPRSSSVPTFRSPLAAQAWFEWRGKGMVVPFLAAGLLALIGLRLLWVGQPERLVPWLSGTWKVLAVLAPLAIGCLMGRFSQSGHSVAIDTFRASRPLADSALTYAALIAGGLALLATWAGMAGVFVGLVGGADVVGGTSYLAAAWSSLVQSIGAMGWVSASLWGLGVMAASWTNMAIVASVFLTGRKPVIVGLVFVPYLLGLIGLVVFEFFDSEAIAGGFQWLAWALAISLLSATAVAFATARRRQLIRTPLVLLAVATWFVACCAVAWHQREPLQEILAHGFGVEQAMLVLVPAALALVVAPLATAPLATAWNRHR